MTKHWVLNASPLIVLCRIRQEQLLLQLADEIIVPQAVVDEIVAGPQDDPARLLLAAEHLLVVPPLPIPPQLAAWDLGSGETAVLTYCLSHPGWTAIVDDRAARRCAASFSIAVKGTLGIILLARRCGLIPSAAAVLHQLRAGGFHLEDGVIAAALWQTVGEIWPGREGISERER